MKKQKPAKLNISVLNQICKLIPEGMLSKIVRDNKLENEFRTFKPWSHVVSLIYSQIAHSSSLNDVCDALKNHSGQLSTIRSATAPSKNGLSTANRNRDPQVAEKLF